MLKHCLTILLALFLLQGAIRADDSIQQGGGSLSGMLKLDSTWARKLYLSSISSFEDQYDMSSEMIIAEAEIMPSGNFNIDLSFLPKEWRFFRLHLRKIEGSRASLILGGPDENHLFFFAKGDSNIELINESSRSPFAQVHFNGSPINGIFEELVSSLAEAERSANQSQSAKRTLIRERVQEALLDFADSTQFPILGLYALHYRGIDHTIANENSRFLALAEKWKTEESNYFSLIKDRMPAQNEENNLNWYLFALLLLPLGLIIGRQFKPKRRGLDKLSVQEKKIYALLQEGASNQEISDQFNIGINTVKSHVSSILGKLKVKSRKELMN